MANQMAATAVALNDLKGQPPVAGLFNCNSSNISAAFYTISTDGVLARSICIAELFVRIAALTRACLFYC